MLQPHVAVWCLPKESEERLKLLFHVLLRAMVRIPEICVSDEEDVLINFVPDSMKWGLGTEIRVQVSGLHKNLNLTLDARNRLAYALGDVLDSWYPESKVLVHIEPPVDPEHDGFWCNRKPTMKAEGIAAMPPSEFFSQDRLRTVTQDQKMLTRLNPIIDFLLVEDPRTREGLNFANMAEFAAHYQNQRVFQRVPNSGKKSAQIIGDVMRASGFQVSNDRLT